MNVAFAVGVLPLDNGAQMHNDPITIIGDLEGNFKAVAYQIRDTGANSGIRYRTTAITFELNGLTGTLPTTALDKLIKPSPGQTVYTLISIDIKDLEDIFGIGNKDKVLEDLKNPQNLQIGAVIEIYNAATGKVLDTINSVDEVYPKASKYGFSSTSINDMESEYTAEKKPVPVIVEPEPPKQESGLRKTILLWDED